MSDYESDDDWKPPSEAEMKVLAAKRERSDKISKRMSDYLLKGYKMLATNCPHCYTIELQDKQGQLYCVACQEIDCHETSKDDPVLNEEAAGKVIAESAFVTQPRSSGSVADVPRLQRIEDPVRNSIQRFEDAPSRLPGEDTQPSAIIGPLRGTAPAAVTMPPSSTLQSSTTIRPEVTSTSHSFSAALPASQLFSSEVSQMFGSSRTVLVSKLDWANRRLEEETRPEVAVNLVILIREIITTLNTFQN